MDVPLHPPFYILNIPVQIQTVKPYVRRNKPYNAATYKNSIIK